MFKGSMPALVTPFSNGAVDFDALKSLVEWQIAEGSHGLVPVGTTGESPTLTHDEHEKVIEVVVATAAGRVPVIAGAGSNNTVEAIRFVEHAKAVGADAALVVTPYYNKPTQKGLIAHFSALNEIGIPIIIYNIPPRSVIDMVPATMGELAKLPNIVGVKDATGDLSPRAEAADRLRQGFHPAFGRGRDRRGLQRAGRDGCISVTANVAPRLCAEMQEATLAGDYAKALDYQDRLMPLHEAIFAEPGVAGAKYGLSVLDRASDEVRLPLTGLEDTTKQKIQAAMRHAGLLN
jgi:4-hydroxy-tetrahydrodipicolinate synthase